MTRTVNEVLRRALREAEITPSDQEPEASDYQNARDTYSGMIAELQVIEGIPCDWPADQVPEEIWLLLASMTKARLNGIYGDEFRALGEAKQFFRWGHSDDRVPGLPVPMENF